MESILCTFYPPYSHVDRPAAFHDLVGTNAGLLQLPVCLCPSSVWQLKKGRREILCVGLTYILSVGLFEGKANCYASEVHC